MVGTELMTAALAGELAGAAGSTAVVCVGCSVDLQLSAGQDDVPLLALVRAPFSGVPLRLETVLLVVVSAGAASGRLLESCAWFGVPEAWLLSAEDELLEVLDRPVAGRYRERRLVFAGESVEIRALANGRGSGPSIRFR
jgi:hypothetical protein